MKKLSVITPCTRPQNLPAIYNSLLPGKDVLDIHWHIVIDGLSVEDPDDDILSFMEWVIAIGGADWVKIYSESCPESVYGKGQINKALDFIDEGLVWVLDDDNVAHPEFFSAINDVKTDAILLTCYHPYSRGKVQPHLVKRGIIDQVQYVLDRSYFDEFKFKMHHDADGFLIEEVFEKYKSNFSFIQEETTFYNSLSSFEFSSDWFNLNTEGLWDTHLKGFEKRPIKAIEIGPFEGRATTWLLRNKLVHPHSRIFSVDIFDSEWSDHGTECRKDCFGILQSNLDKTGSSWKATLVKGRSSDFFKIVGDSTVDFVYVDGDHNPDMVFQDGMESVRVLKTGGILIFDDFEWKPPLDWKYGHPKEGILKVLEECGNDVIIVHQGYQVVLRKV